MKQVRLLKLELTNYRNIEHEVLVFNGNNSKIVGENRIGKTNTLEAIYFLLSNYLLDGSSDLSAIKPLSDTTKAVQVEGTFEITDGDKVREITLKKVYGEKWVKTRGTDDVSMQGHYEKYFVNGIETPKEKDFYNLLEEYFGIRNDEKGEVDPTQMLINPLYLGNLGESKDWTKLRTYIIKLIGDVEDKEIFEKAPSTKVIEQDLLNALGKTDMLKKQYKDQIETLNTQLLGFDSQVELLEQTSKPTDDEVEKAKVEIETIDNKIYDLKTKGDKDSVVEQLEKEVFELTKTIVAKNQSEFGYYLTNSTAKGKQEHDEKVNNLHSEINRYVDFLTDTKLERGKIESQVKAKEVVRDNLLKQYKDIETKIKNVDTELVKECPTCHRLFEEEELETRKAEMLTNLTAMKDKIIDEGKKIKSEQEKLNNEAKAYYQDEVKTQAKIDELKKELVELEKETFEKPVFKESDELVALREKEKKLKSELADKKAKASEKASDNYELVMKLESDKINAQKVIDDMNYYERQMTLLDSVKTERQAVSKTLIQVEQKREALTTYIYTKLRVLDEHIAKVFGKIKFQLIKENINGGFDPVCKPYVYDVDKNESTDTLWKSASKSEKIITGIAIVEAIRKELDLTELPYLFDEGGEISSETLHNKFKTNAQIICVRVEDNVMKPIVVKF